LSDPTSDRRTWLNEVAVQARIAGYLHTTLAAFVIRHCPKPVAWMAEKLEAARRGPLVSRTCRRELIPQPAQKNTKRNRYSTRGDVGGELTIECVKAESPLAMQLPRQNPIKAIRATLI
jgi:hypothetical protein